MPEDVYCLIPFMILSGLYGWFIAGPVFMYTAIDFFSYLDSLKRKG